MKTTSTSSKIQSKKNPGFNAQAFLNSAGVARRIVEYGRSQKNYSQGDPTNNVLYIQKGGIKLSVVNEVGKEAVVAMLGPGDFFGEGGGWSGRSNGDGDRDHTHDFTRYRKTRDDSPAALRT